LQKLGQKRQDALPFQLRKLSPRIPTAPPMRQLNCKLAMDFIELLIFANLTATREGVLI